MDKKNKNPNVPNLRFKEYKDEWIIDDIGNVISIDCPKYNPLKGKNIYPCIELDNLDQETGILLNTYNSKNQNSIKNKFEKENILYGKLRPYLKKYFYPNFEGVCSTEIWVMKSIKLLPKWIYYFVQTDYFSNLTNISSGSKMPRADWNYIKNELIYYPKNSQEAMKIADMLETIDKRIQTQIKIIKDLESVKNEISNRIFKLKLIEKSTKYLAEYLREGDKTPVNTFKYKKITIKLNKQGIVYSDINRDMADTRPFYIRHKDELIIGKQNYFNGSIAIVDEQYDNCICSNAIMSFNVVGINKEFLYFQLSNNNYLNSQSYKANGTGQKELSEKELLNFKIWCPSIEEQIKIVNCFKALDGKIKNEKAVLNSYMQEKDYLLTNMFI